ncbi:hypothetical protein ACHAXT_000168 [Thalassiosira profunda]
MERLAAAFPALGPYVIRERRGAPCRPTIDFADPFAVRALNTALLVADYGVNPRYAEIVPKDALFPPVPGREDYVHHVADALGRCTSSGKVPTGSSVVGMDIGAGASCIYPTISASAYGWQMIASEINKTSIESAREIVDANNHSHLIDVRHQESSEAIFDGVLRPGETVDFAMCNPPFYRSPEEFREENARKLRGLARGGLNKGRPAAERDPVEPKLREEGGTTSNNFGGTESELWCRGGEVSFVKRIIAESKQYARRCLWFTSLVSRKENVKKIEGALYNMGKKGDMRQLRVQTIDTIRMGAGRKGATILLWSFLDETERFEWAKLRGWG